MAINVLEKKETATQRRVRRWRQRLGHTNHHLLIGNGAQHSNGATSLPKKRLIAKDLGWTDEEIEASYYYYKRFAPYWEGPGMDEYDEM